MELYSLLLPSWIALSAVIAIFLLFVQAPYGRHFSRQWGPVMDNRMGWVIMESAVLLFTGIFFAGNAPYSAMQIVMISLLMAHYIYRSYLFPLRLRTANKKIPVIIVVFGILHNVGNSYLNGYYLGHIGQWPMDWYGSWQFVSGCIIFLAGFVLHYTSDGILINLRAPGETGYKIPTGGLYSLVSCPNYLGELIQWAGFTLLTMSPGAAAFLCFTAANLIPRAISSHRWYLDKFDDYPQDRKAILPFVL